MVCWHLQCGGAGLCGPYFGSFQAVAAGQSQARMTGLQPSKGMSI